MYQDYEKKYNLSPTREPIGKCLGRNAKRAFAKHSLESPALLEHFLLRINKIIRKEMSQVLRDTAYTIKKAQRGSPLVGERIPHITTESTSSCTIS